MIRPFSTQYPGSAPHPITAPPTATAVEEPVAEPSPDTSLASELSPPEVQQAKLAPGVYRRGQVVLRWASPSGESSEPIDIRVEAEIPAPRALHKGAFSTIGEGVVWASFLGVQAVVSLDQDDRIRLWTVTADSELLRSASGGSWERAEAVEDVDGVVGLIVNPGLLIPAMTGEEIAAARFGRGRNALFPFPDEYRAVGASLLAEPAAADRAGRILIEMVRGRARSYLLRVKDALASSEATLGPAGAPDQKKHAADWKVFRWCLIADAKLHEQEVKLRKEMADLEDVGWSGVSKSIRGKISSGVEARTRIPAVRQALDQVRLARLYLREDRPELACINLAKVEPDAADRDLWSLVIEGFEAMRWKISNVEEEVVGGNIPLVELRPLVEEILGDLGVIRGVVGSALSNSIQDFLEEAGYWEKAAVWSKARFTLGSGMADRAARYSDGRWGSPVVVGGLGIIPALAGATFNVERHRSLAVSVDSRLDKDATDADLERARGKFLQQAVEKALSGSRRLIG